LLLRHPVHDSGALMNLADFVRFASVKKNSFGRRRFTGVDVGHNADVTNKAEGGFFGGGVRRFRTHGILVTTKSRRTKGFFANTRKATTLRPKWRFGPLSTEAPDEVFAKKTESHKIKKALLFPGGPFLNNLLPTIMSESFVRFCHLVHVFAFFHRTAAAVRSFDHFGSKAFCHGMLWTSASCFDQPARC
jgi:hypothetical protein